MTNAQVAIQSAFYGKWGMDSVDIDGRIDLAERLLQWMNTKDNDLMFQDMRSPNAPIGSSTQHPSTKPSTSL